jgi:hypothetical protein
MLTAPLPIFLDLPRTAQWIHSSMSARAGLQPGAPDVVPIQEKRFVNAAGANRSTISGVIALAWMIWA